MAQPFKSMLIALAMITGATLLLFGENLFSSGVSFPAHTRCFLPWRNHISLEQEREAFSRLNRTVTDKNFSFHPDNMVTAKAFQSKRLPLWNPNQMAGVPHLGQSLYGVFYPLNLPLFLWGPERVYGPITALHYILAGFFTYLLLRRLKMGQTPAIVGGLVFICCANMTGRFHYYMTMYPMAWAPLMFYLIHRFHEKRSVFPLVGLSICCALIVLSGFQQVAQYILYICMGFSLLLGANGRLRIRWRQGISLGLLLSALGVFLVAQDWAFGAFDKYSVVTMTLLLFPVGLLMAGQGFFKWILSSLPIGICLLLGVGLAMAQMWPALTLMKHSSRALPNLVAMMGELSLSKEGLLGFLSPLLLCDPMWCLSESVQNYANSALSGFMGSQGFVFPNYVEWSLYMGLLPLAFLGCLRLGQKDSSPIFFFGGVGVLFLVTAFGVWVVLFPMYFIGFVLDPRRGLLIFSFAASLLAAYGLESLLLNEVRKIRPVCFGTALLVLAILCGIGGAFYSDELAGKLFDMAKARGVLNEASILQENAHQIKSAMLHLALAAALSGAALLRLVFRPGRIALILVFTAIGFDLIPICWHVNPIQEREGFLEPDPSFAHMQKESENDHFRIFRFARDQSSSSLKIPLPGDMSTHFGLEDGEGYIVQPLKRYYHLMNRIQMDMAQGVWVLPLSKKEALRSAYLDLLGVRYVLATAEIPDKYGFEKVYQKKGYSVHKNREAFPRAFLVQEWTCVKPGDFAAVFKEMEGADLRKRVVLEQEVKELNVKAKEMPEAKVNYLTPEEIEITFEFPAPKSFLVLTDAYYPGWKAQVEGEETPVLPANCTFRAIQIPEGTTTATFTFEPAEVRVGILISILSGVLVVLVMLVGLRWSELL